MDAILTAIYALYSGNAALKAALPGGLHYEVAPQSTTTTYATYFLVDAMPEYWFGGRKYELTRIQFDIYGYTNALRMTAYNALIALYDDSRPTATGYTAIIMERENQQMLRDGDNDKLFRAMVDYQCRFLKS